MVGKGFLFPPPKDQVVPSCDVQSRFATGIPYMARKQTQRRRGQRTKRGQNPSSSQKGFVMGGLSRAPTAESRTIGSTGVRSQQTIHDTSLGEGVRVHGFDIISSVQVKGTGAASAYALGIFASTVNSYMNALLGPNGAFVGAIFTSTTLPRMSRAYGFYRYKRIRLHYIPSCATSVATQIAIGVCNDYVVSGYGVTTPSMFEAQACPLALVTSAWQAATTAWWECPRTRNAYWVDAGSASTAENRDHYQLLILGFADSTAEAVYGKLYFEYEIEYFGRGTPVTATPDMHLQSVCRTAEEKAFLRELQRRSLVDPIMTDTPYCTPIDLQRVGASAFGGYHDTPTAVSLPVNIVGVSENHGFLSVPTDINRVAGTAVPMTSGEYSYNGVLPIDVTSHDARSVSVHPLEIRGTTEHNSTMCLAVTGSEAGSAAALSVVQPEGSYLETNAHQPVGVNYRTIQPSGETYNVNVLGDEAKETYVVVPPKVTGSKQALPTSVRERAAAFNGAARPSS